LCKLWHCPPSVARAEAAEELRLYEIVRLGSREDVEGGE
jgi:hypothetical protein